MAKTGNWVEDTLNGLRTIFWVGAIAVLLTPVWLGAILYLIVVK